MNYSFENNTGQFLPEVMGEDLYDWLGATPDASYEDLRQAYRGIVKAHADVRLLDDADSANLEIVIKASKAWQVLSNDELRQSYDKSRKIPQPASITNTRSATGDMLGFLNTFLRP